MSDTDLRHVLTLTGDRSDPVFLDGDGVYHLNPEWVEDDIRYKESDSAYVASYREPRSIFARLRTLFHRSQAQLYRPDRPRWRGFDARWTTPVPRVLSYGSFLDVGCNTGTLLARLPQEWERHGVEINAEAASLAGRTPGVTIYQGRLEDIHGSDRFDFIRASHVIEHVTDYRGFLANTFRLCKPGGRVLIYSPNTRSVALRLFGRHWHPFYDKTHYRLFNVDNLAAACRAEGFRVAHKGSYSMGITAGSMLRAVGIRSDTKASRTLLLALIVFGFPFSIFVNMFGRGGALFIYLEKP